ncbi:DUF262 domain-containing protein [Hydrogenophaga atypica]|uniref:DUF262 domain-containing protein n=1 Tax=Hydrogenophaga atypica TaxID=249409 RepID=A0ABW2QQZ5_9BURK
MTIKSELYSLEAIVKERPDWHFNIPIYQRLYVWGEDQVLTLLNDLVNAYERGEEIFFLGGTLLVEQAGAHGPHFDLIDGQQRFTTLWMLCHAWREALTPFLATTTGDKRIKPRLRFAIRPEVNSFLETMVFGDQGRAVPDDEATKRMRIALDLMRSVFEKRPLPAGVTNLQAHLRGLTEFVFGRVKFVITTVPPETDLNKLFEVINNRGVQLQHHEILKARMLDALNEDERGSYAVLWDACADMENFVERNLSGNFKGFASEVADCYDSGQLTVASAVRAILAKRIQEQNHHHALTLAEILQAPDDAQAGGGETETEATEPTWVRGMFGFPLFLQHVLRIWLFEHGRPDLPRLLDRELLALFEEHFFKPAEDRRESVRSFIDLLWRLRVIFDEHLIKWVDQGEEEIHLISAVSLSPSSGKRYMSRSRESDSHQGFSLLQSMLYHSQEITTQYWVTPLLYFMHRNLESDAARYFAYLRHLDNHMLGSDASGSLVVRSRSFMEDPWRRSNAIHAVEIAKPSGVKFAHYWFYKLEFVLWFQKKRQTERWRKFRLTAKSSVEHISPQTPTKRDDNRVDEALDYFGNLALVSRSLNSEYGNLPFNEKRQRFLNNNKSRLDSLKMDLIYERDRWNDDMAFSHQQEMISCLSDYWENTLRLVP